MSLRSKESGSIVVEAAAVLPAFLFFILLLIHFIQMSVVSMALNGAVSETARQISAHMYPVALAYESHDSSEWGAKLNDTLGRARRGWDEWMPVDDMLRRYAEAFPSPVGELAEMAGTYWQDWKDRAFERAQLEAGSLLVRPLLLELMNDRLLEEERLSIDRILFPDLKNRQEAYFGIEVSYRMPMQIPFLSRPIVIREQAYERVWIGDAPESTDSGRQGEGIRILSISPEPVRLAKTAVVVAKVAPGGKAYLTVIYKSGESRAKHLGEAVADGEGIVSWEWFVSGNTTPGIWSVIATSEDGGHAEAQFQVVRGNS